MIATDYGCAAAGLLLINQFLGAGFPWQLASALAFGLVVCIRVAGTEAGEALYRKLWP